MTLDEAIAELMTEGDVRFARLITIATAFFGEPRIKGSHHIFKTPWLGDARINIQKDGKDAKTYQVRQVLAALTKRKEQDSAKG